MSLIIKNVSFQYSRWLRGIKQNHYLQNRVNRQGLSTPSFQSYRGDFLSLSVPDPRGGGVGACAPLPHKGHECPKNNFFHALYDIVSIYGNA